MGTPDSIDWSHVADNLRWMCRNPNGDAYLLEKEPDKESGKYWACDECCYCDVVNFASYVRGTCDWKDSLVQRPEGV